ncbi:YhjD/YihY/BrkB family envelope integrity protein [Haloprofundus salinisoli]|uniref:YhjD/YihY/BrkB family envelope integrity protein n=1 Tax=Haloprofundus salinisoli TaxID=2876193 RepID=UPI001CCD5F0D|nr:YhjD/YihY/BrkB family envelope integrity protein [Haloprofundus salinisoli]
MSTRRSPIAVGRGVLAEFRSKNVAFMAGSIAYNAFVSLIPLLLLVVLLVSLLGSEQLEGRVSGLVASSLTPATGELVSNALDSASEGTGLSIVGVVVLLWGTLKIFRGLDTAFSEIYETEGSNEFVDQLRDGLVVFVALLVGITAMVAASTAFAAFESLPWVGLLNPLVLILGLSIAFLPLYYVFPDADLSVRGILPGVLTAAVGWALLQGVFQFYIAFSDKSEAYGVLGGVILLVTWLYFGGLVLLLGAVVNAVVGGYATGASGGVGRGAAERAANRELLREDRLNRDQAASYLRRLREDVARRYEGMEPMSTDGTPGRSRMPETGTLEVEERAFEEDDGRTYEVRLRWELGESDAHTGAAAATDTADADSPDRSSTPADD